MQRQANGGRGSRSASGAEVANDDEVELLRCCRVPSTCLLGALVASPKSGEVPESETVSDFEEYNPKIPDPQFISPCFCVFFLFLLIFLYSHYIILNLNHNYYYYFVFFLST